ncbi:hypothetical protein EVC62_15965 [Salinicola endophyticus]|uniref:Cyclodeaminase/cyclohydrolase domain-containing protein n=1 Tax=Salinicola endophyticus TaxID=1949083 RepID=A0ABY8FLE1_9GAMM|nr:hypothetical protein [Salinicola endophyticus]WFF42870.1 hypothetical protein EVC62_15965 [Salinicola endophyticus]
MADEAFWAQFLANGAGAAVGAVVGGALAYLGASAVSRQQTRQAKLEQCLTLNRNIANLSGEVLWSISKATDSEGLNAAKKIALKLGEGQLQSWADDLYTLIEIHSPRHTGLAENILLAVAETEGLIEAFAGQPESAALQTDPFGGYANALRKSLLAGTNKLKAHILHQASTVSRSKRERASMKSKSVLDELCDNQVE